MSSVTDAPAIVSTEGARRIEKVAKLAAALLPNIVAAAEELEVARTLGQSDQEFFGTLAQIARTERPRMLAIELLGKGMTGREVAKQTGLTEARVSQLKKSNSPKFKRSVKLVFDFMIENDANDFVMEALEMIVSSPARKMIDKLFESIPAA